MVRVLICLFFLFSILPSEEWDGNMNTFAKIEIYRGYTIYGTTSLKLTEEGLIYRKSWDKHVIKFIPFKKLNRNKLRRLQTFVIRNNYFADYDTLLEEKYITLDKVPDIYVIRKGNYENIKVIKDDTQNAKLDSLNILMNELL